MSGAVEYLEIYDEVVHYIHKNFEPEQRNLVGAIERDGKGWVVRWGFATVQRIAPPQNQIGDIYQLMAYIYFMARGDMRLIKILPLADKREWHTYIVSG
ncbi:MAG: hypothetical protein SFZ02_19265 [bacterium]|nr:hypothetical protein [bacterium]